MFSLRNSTITFRKLAISTVEKKTFQTYFDQCLIGAQVQSCRISFLKQFLPTKLHQTIRKILPQMSEMETDSLIGNKRSVEEAGLEDNSDPSKK